MNRVSRHSQSEPVRDRPCAQIRLTTLLVSALCFISTADAQESAGRSPVRFLKRAASGLKSRLAMPGSKVAGHVPQLGRIYSRAAQADHGRSNPVIVIPGILGSRLLDSRTNKVLWGTVKLSQTRAFRRQADTDIALPMARGKKLEELRDSVVASDILDELKVKVAGYPVGIQAYSDVLSTLGVGGYRSQAAATLGVVNYGEDHFTCFEFHYDWRRDCSENAAILAEFIRQKSEYVRQQRARRYGITDAPVQFDIVAHSMGGLIARYYLRYGDQPLPSDERLPELTWSGAANVGTLVLVGSPNAGSTIALDEMINGMEYSKAFPKYDAAIIGTMPAVYQLLPRPRHRAVVDDSGRRVNFYDWRVWKIYGWGLLDSRQDNVLKILLPGVDRATRQRIAQEHLRKCLWRAWKFHQALDVASSPPPGTELFLIAGDSELTPARVAVAAGETNVVEETPGDGTVTRASTLMDERLGIDDEVWTPRLQSPIHWSGTNFIFTDHLGLTSSPAFADNVLYLLLERPR